MKLTLEKGALYLAQLAATIAMLGSLYFSEVLHYIPCEWCWRQRIVMYPMALLIPMGILRRDRHLPIYTLVISAIGIGFSTFHYLLQKTSWFNSLGSCTSGVPCNVSEINWFGFVTIPFLALIAFLIIFVCSLLVVTSDKPIWEEDEKPSWIPTLGVSAVVLLAFLPSFLTAGSKPEGNTISALTTTTVPTFVTTGVEAGHDLYVTNCAQCHGAGAQGVAGIGPALLGSDFLANTSKDDWVDMVVEGRGAMPPRGGHPDLSDDDIASIYEFLRVQP